MALTDKEKFRRELHHFADIFSYDVFIAERLEEIAMEIRDKVMNSERMSKL